MTRLPALVLTVVLAIALTSCAATASTKPHDSTDPFAHAHGIVSDTRGDVFIATHTGIFSLSRDGKIAGLVLSVSSDIGRSGDSVRESGYR